LLNADILSLVVSIAGARNEQVDFKILTNSGEVSLGADILPTDDSEAAEAIFRLLERTQILLPTQSFAESAGI
jgi:hypothetical protein